jgi:hypothetical protein
MEQAFTMECRARPAMARQASPAGVVNILANGESLGAHLVGHPGVDRISVTGPRMRSPGAWGRCSEGLMCVVRPSSNRFSPSVRYLDGLPVPDLSRSLG